MDEKEYTSVINKKEKIEMILRDRVKKCVFQTNFIKNIENCYYYVIIIIGG